MLKAFGEFSYDCVAIAVGKIAYIYCCLLRRGKNWVRSPVIDDASSDDTMTARDSMCIEAKSEVSSTRLRHSTRNIARNVGSAKLRNIATRNQYDVLYVACLFRGVGWIDDKSESRCR